VVAVAADDAGELGLRRPGSMVDRPTGVAGARRARGSTATTTGPAASAWPWSVARYGRRPQRPPASRGDHGSRPRSPVQPSHGVAAAPQPCQSEAQVQDLPVGVIGHDPPSQHPPPRACPPSRSSASSAGPAARQPRL